MLRARAAVNGLPTYHPPLAGREGVRLDFNENTAGCSPRVLERLRSLDAGQLSKYPERKPVERILAEFLQVAPEEILLTNGVDEGIHLLCESYLEPGDEALIVEPTYSMYQIYALATGAKVRRVPLASGFQFSVEDVKAQISERTRLIAIANPNNPTGTVASGPELLEIARSAPPAALLVDEAYFEFYGQTVMRAWREIPNVFVARTFSKSYGLAGLRMGVLAGEATHMRAVRCACSPYNVNAVALACLPDAIADAEYVAHYVSDVLEGRGRLEAALASRGIEFWPSRANFVLIRAGRTADDAAQFVDEMRQRGILVRDRSRDAGCEGCVRITVGPREQMDRLMDALPEVLAEVSAAKGRVRR